MYDILYGTFNIDCNNMFNYHANIVSHNMNTSGNSCKHFVNRSNSNLYLHSFFARTVRVWNSLPDNTVSCISRKLFLHSLTDNLLHNFLHGRTINRPYLAPFVHCFLY
jgi:hypothetical protein